MKIQIQTILPSFWRGLVGLTSPPPSLSFVRHPSAVPEQDKPLWAKRRYRKQSDYLYEINLPDHFF